jgi:DNA polymerase-4
VTHDKQGIGSAVKIAKAIRAAIRDETGLTASAGVSYNKFIAKLASDQNKPDGMCVILPDQGPEFVASLPVRRFYGVGPRTAEKMAKLGVNTGADLALKDEAWLAQHFGNWGGYLFWAARGIDHRPVIANSVRKSIGAESTYADDKRSEAELRDALEAIIDVVWGRIERNQAQGRTLVLKARYSDFRTITRSRTVGYALSDRATIAQVGHALLDQILPVEMGVRLLGLTLSGLVDSNEITHGATPQGQFAFG